MAKQYVLPQGMVVKIQGIPVEIVQDVRVAIHHSNYKTLCEWIPEFSERVVPADENEMED